MKSIDHLRGLGITPRLKTGGKIGLQGMGGLSDEVKAEVITWARDNRESILQELDPNVLNAFTQKGFEADLTPPEIEPMTTCLHGKSCHYLEGPGERRPVCSKADAFVFDLEACPVNQWARRQPKLAASLEPAPRNETEDTRQQQADPGQAVVANIKTDARLIEWAKKSKR